MAKMTSTEMFVEIRAKLDKLQSDLKKGKREFDLFGKTITKLGGVIAGVFAVHKIVSFAKETSKLAAEAEGVQKAFKRIADVNTLNELRDATRGTVSDLELMKAAVQANNFEIPLSQMGKLLEFAHQRAKDTGQSVDFLVNSIVLGIGRKSPLILDNLGISAVKLRSELKGIGTETASTMDIAAAVAKIAAEEMKKVSDTTLTSAERQAQLNAQWENTKISVGDSVNILRNALIPVLTKAAEFAGHLAENLALIFEKGYFGAKNFKQAEYEVNDALETTSNAYIKLGKAKSEDEAKQMAVNSQLKIYKSYLADTTIGDEDQRLIWEAKVGILSEMAQEYSKVNTQAARYNEIQKVPVPEIPAIVEPEMEFPDIKEWNPNELMFDEAGAKELETYSKWIDKIGESLQEVKLQTNNTSSAFSGLGQNIAQIWSDGIEGSESFADAIKQSIKATIKALIAEGLTAVISKALETYPPPASLAIAAASGAAAGALMYGVSKFEKGGIVGGSTFSGDTQLIRANSGEMILNHRQQANLLALANGSGSGIPHTIILKAQGNDLVGVIDRTNKYYSRTR
jgi:hypothetical protein